MAISAYVGLMGSGKSYEVVKSVILPALASGRRVVTNVSGLKIDEINAYLVEHGSEMEKLGTIVEVGKEQIMSPGFFPIFDENKKLIEKPGIVEGGDLIAIDEVWRYWPAPTVKFSDEHQQFFRLHRQITNAEGLACDIVIICQDIYDIDRKLRAVVQTTFRMEKLVALGMNKRYRVDVFPGGKIGRKPLNEFQRKYDPDIFVLYSSYTAAKGKEDVVDGRQSVFSGSFFRLGLPLAVLLLVAGVWSLTSIFGKMSGKDDKGGKTDIASYAKASGDKSAVLLSKSPDFSSSWRVTGLIVRDGLTLVSLVGEGGRIRTVASPRAWELSIGGNMAVMLPDGGWATSFSGPVGRPGEGAPSFLPGSRR